MYIERFNDALCFERGGWPTFYGDSHKFVLNEVALLGEPAVAPKIQSTITYEICYT